MKEEEVREKKLEEQKNPNVQFVSFSEQQPDGTVREAYGYVDYSQSDETTINERVEELRSFLKHR